MRGGERSGGVPGLWWPSESSDEPGSQNKAVEEMQSEREKGRRQVSKLSGSLAVRGGERT